MKDEPGVLPLKANPFRIDQSFGRYYLSEENRLAYQRVVSSLDDFGSFTLVDGDAGVGKTSLILNILAEYDLSGQSVTIFETDYDLDRLGALVCERAGAQIGPGQSWQAVFTDFLSRRLSSGQATLLVLDGMDQADLDTVLEFVDLFPPSSAGNATLKYLLIGRRPFADVFETRLFSLRGEADVVKCRIEPLSLSDTHALIDLKSRDGGAAADILFANDALELIASRSNGNPRRVFSICERALILGATHGQAKVGASEVRQALTEIGRRDKERGGERQQVAAPVPTSDPGPKKPADKKPALAPKTSQTDASAPEPTLATRAPVLAPPVASSRGSPERAESPPTLPEPVIAARETAGRPRRRIWPAVALSMLTLAAGAAAGLYVVGRNDIGPVAGYRDQVASITAERDSLLRRVQSVEAEKQAISGELDRALSAAAEVDPATQAEIDKLNTALESLQSERDRLIAERDAFAANELALAEESESRDEVATRELKRLRLALAETSAARDIAAQEKDALVQEREALAEDTAALAEERDRMAETNQQLSDERIQLAADLEGLAAERDRLAAANDQLAALRDELSEASDSANARQEVLAAQLGERTAERDRLSADLERLRDERDGLVAANVTLVAERQSLSTEVGELTRERDRFETASDALTTERDKLVTLTEELVTERDSLRSENEELATENEEFAASQATASGDNAAMSAQISELLEERDELIQTVEALIGERERAALAAAESKLDPDGEAADQPGIDEEDSVTARPAVAPRPAGISANASLSVPTNVGLSGLVQSRPTVTASDAKLLPPAGTELAALSTTVTEADPDDPSAVDDEAAEADAGEEESAADSEAETEDEPEVEKVVDPALQRRFFGALATGSVPGVVAAIDAGAVTDVPNDDGDIALVLAAAKGQTTIARAVLDAGADPDVPNGAGETAILVAAREGRTSIVRSLLDAGADPNRASDTRWTPLLQAAINGHTEVVSLLIDGDAALNGRSRSGLTPLAAAAWNGHVSVARALVENGADVDLVDDAGTSPLMHAAWNGHAAVVGLLLDADADANVTEKSGWTALMKAAWNGKVESVSLLLDHGIDAGVTNAEGETALVLAVRQGHDDAAGMIRDYNQ